MAKRSGDISVDGLKEVLSTLTKIGVETQELKTAVAEGSQILANALRSEVPIRTGTLAATIRPAKAKGYARALIGRKRPRHYAPFVDMGTSRQPARRFRDKALAKSKVPALHAIQKNLNAIFTKYGF